MPPIHWDTIITGLVSAGILWAVRQTSKAVTNYQTESKAWRTGMSGKMDALTDATQTTMRATLIHYYDKYSERGWLTSEEHAAWHDMHEKYSALNANGLIDSYAERINELPHRNI